MKVEAAQLKERLAAHELFDWCAGDEAPTDDLDVVLVVGSLDRGAIANERLFVLESDETELQRAR